MKVLVDTNIIVDVFSKREPYYEIAQNVLRICCREDVDGILAAHSVTNLFYILRKNFSVSERKDILLSLFDVFEVEQIDTVKIKKALANDDFNDFEDCLQMECAIKSKADYIVTRNTIDFVKSKIPCLLPEDFCNMVTERDSLENND